MMIPHTIRVPNAAPIPIPTLAAALMPPLAAVFWAVPACVGTVLTLLPLLVLPVLNGVAADVAEAEAGTVVADIVKVAVMESLTAHAGSSSLRRTTTPFANTQFPDV